MPKRSFTSPMASSKIHARPSKEDIASLDLLWSRPFLPPAGGSGSCPRSTTIFSSATPDAPTLNKRTPNGEEKKEKRRTLAIALTREETEEDVFAMTRARPSRRPRTVQRQIGFYEFSLVISTVD
ncbi:hypothetical protein RJ640_009955 [Escallonia rubra]|uniref:Uncharacterized protein n=1 Tax=Escallonia rubra TaxID=112253 RepID=A0AA88QUR1_9ASTE|nr:hypothetical protein RJ640_009955 [Escallonia rubra]